MTAENLCKRLFKCTDAKSDGDTLTLIFPTGREIFFSLYHDNEMVLSEIIEACVESGTFSFESATLKMFGKLSIEKFIANRTANNRINTDAKSAAQ